MIWDINPMEKEIKFLAWNHFVKLLEGAPITVAMPKNNVAMPKNTFSSDRE